MKSKAFIEMNYTGATFWLHEYRSYYPKNRRQRIENAIINRRLSIQNWMILAEVTV